MNEKTEKLTTRKTEICAKTEVHERQCERRIEATDLKKQ